MEEILNDFSHLFFIEKINQHVESQINQMTIQKGNKKFFSLEDIKKIEDLNPNRIDFEKLIANEKPLYGYDDKV